MKKRYYLAYGSNMNREQMAYRCPTAVMVGAAIIYNYRLRFNGVATIEPAKGERVPVVIWELQEQDERSLDRYEGYPRYYYKKNFTVELNGEKLKAMAYIMTEGRECAPPYRAYYEGIAQGYRWAELDSAPLEEALKRAVKASAERVWAGK